MNRYRLGERIGQGGMALVNEATRLLADDTPQPIAIKRIQPEHELHPLAQARFRLEAAIGLAFAHPHLVKVFDYDRCGLSPCIVMEHVDGLSLHDLARCIRLPHDVVRLVLWDIAMALSYVHDQGVLHRDVSPSNILVSRHGAVKLADFGLALDLRQPRTTPGFKGTPAYASPEALRGELLDPSSDLYALAAVGYELVMGAPPYGHGSPEEIARRQAPASGWVVAPVPDDVPIDLRMLFAGLLAPVGERPICTGDLFTGVLEHYELPPASRASLAALVAYGKERSATRKRPAAGKAGRAPAGKHASEHDGKRPRTSPRTWPSRTIFTMLFLLGLGGSWHAITPERSRASDAGHINRAAAAGPAMPTPALAPDTRAPERDAPAPNTAPLEAAAPATDTSPRDRTASLAGPADDGAEEHRPALRDTRDQKPRRAARMPAPRARGVGGVRAGSSTREASHKSGVARGVAAHHGFQP